METRRAPTDLIFSVALECSIFTRLATYEDSSTAKATGTIRAWVEVDGSIVPINSISASATDALLAGTEADKVTFCDRTYQRSVTDDEDPLDGQDVEEDFIDTKSANAFHWLRLDLGSGDHEVVVKATRVETVEGDATAEAVIGNRVLVALVSFSPLRPRLGGA